MISASFYNKLRQILDKKENSIFYDITAPYYKKTQQLDYIVHILIENKQVNEYELNEIDNNMDGNKFDKYIYELLHKITNYPPFEIIDNENLHISNLSNLLSKYQHHNTFSDIFHNNQHIIYINNNDNNMILYNIKQEILQFKKSKPNYQLFMGHLMEDLVGTFMLAYINIIEATEPIDINNEDNIIDFDVLNFMFDDTAYGDIIKTLQDNYVKLFNTVFISKPDINALIGIIYKAINAVINEVLSKNNDNEEIIESLKQFITDLLTINTHNEVNSFGELFDEQQNENNDISEQKDNSISEQEDNIFDILINYLPYLYEEVGKMMQQLTKNNSHILKTKYRVDYRNVYGETDYILINNDKENDCYLNAMLMDCKMYNNIDEEIMNKFTYQLIGYYYQHKLLSLRPSYSDINNFNINKFIIVNPLDRYSKFSYYEINIDINTINEFKEMLNIWDTYIEKCLNYNKDNELK